MSYVTVYGTGSDTVIRIISFRIVRQIDKERGKTPCAANLMYMKYMSCRTRGFDKAICDLARYSTAISLMSTSFPRTK